VLSPLLAMLLVWAVARHYVLWKAAWKALLQMVDAADLNWDSHTTTTYPAICECKGSAALSMASGGYILVLNTVQASCFSTGNLPGQFRTAQLST